MCAPNQGMDCKPSKNANKKLIQARLPFKRLNPEPKENHLPKRPCPHVYPESSDREIENESSPLPEQSRPPLVNGRGPLDGFLSRRHPAASDETMVIDLTEENTSKCLVSPAAPSPCLPTKDEHQGKDKTASSEKPSNLDNAHKHTLDSTAVSDDEVEEADDEDDEEEEEEEEDEEEDEDEDGNQTASISQLDTTQDSDSEPEEQDESGNVSSLGNKSMLSASSASSMSESSPEKSKTDDLTPTTTPTEPKTTPKIPSDQKKIKRRSLKSLQEQEDRLRLRQEKERQREEAKAAKEKKKEEARKQKEEREREKREKKEKDEQEKREKKEKEEKEKAERLKAKEELRKSKQEAKVEEKRKKEEEKRMKEEEKRVKEEKDRLKAEKAEITRFLQKSKIQQAPKKLAAACGKFAPFEIKENMSLAPLCRVQCEDSVLEELDRCLLNPSNNRNGLKDWIGQKPRQSGPTKPRQRASLSECVTVEGPKADGVPDRTRYGPMKLLQFHKNYRPAYWGTWSKKSSYVSPRCPLRRDKDLLDYEVDSDEEWEEEEPGESLSHSEGEDEEEGGEDDDDDDGFFVPHGYLSNDEGALEEEEGGDLEKQKLRQTLKAREWDELMSTKKKMKVLEPVVRGCIWEGEGPGSEHLQPYAVCLVEPLPKADSSLSPEQLSQKCQREAQLISQLLPLLHGNANSSKVIISEYQEFCRRQTSSSSSSSSPPELSSPQNPAENIPTRIQLRRLIKNNAVYEKRSTYRRCCWYVHTDVLSRLGKEALPVPCQWTYLTTGAREESREEAQAATGSQGNSPTTPQTSSTTSSSSNKRKSTGSMSITKFMKRCTDPGQTEATEADGFQADNEDEDEEDCVLISTQSGPTRENSSSKADVLMEVAPSDTAALPVASAAPTLATA
ncbi:putative chromatin assembly factor 1 subunit A isoform 3 [Scophthalmus maximus]|uniref:Putative chromatin assembly factor 1 subunit A isoform 3 n=1 Tax=Scophthalmus maximus TaxID=52904 RepID=A0A2U9C5L4_SCOMX|nr:putative chromatin assembly factor 1 subunit A isoform 3 [Scophthalmus maximus]